VACTLDSQEKRGNTSAGWGDGLPPSARSAAIGSTPSSGSDTYGDDVLAVLDALKLERPVLVGHSIGGQELSSVATRFPTRVAAVVYLEAAYPYAFDNGTGPTFEQMQSLPGPQPPQPTEADLASFTTVQQYLLRVQGVTFPESELRQQRPVGPNGRIGKPRDFPGYSTLLRGMKNTSIFGFPRSWPLRFLTVSVLGSKAVRTPRYASRRRRMRPR
jgi:pimeloyl-ACP methyl ester carboxylesterase